MENVIEMLDKELEKYQAEKEETQKQTCDEMVAERLAEYEKQLRAEYEAEKQSKLHELDISILAIKRVKENILAQQAEEKTEPIEVTNDIENTETL